MTNKYRSRTAAGIPTKVIIPLYTIPSYAVAKVAFF